MSVTMAPITRLSSSWWLASWSVSTPGATCHVYFQGKLVRSSPQTSIRVESETEPLVEVFDALPAAPVQLAHPGRVVLAWNAVAGAVKYRVEERVGESWLSRGHVLPATGGYHRWESRFLADAATGRFRVVAVNASGEESTALERQYLVVRHPDAPAVALSVASGTLTVGASS
jgi:hypothetical protein